MRLLICCSLPSVLAGIEGQVSWRWISASLVALTLLAASSPYGHAHRSGCHRWHSCPSDTGSYVCGDTGHCSACPDNEYCLASKSRQAQAQPDQPQQTRPGVPPKDTWTCPKLSPSRATSRLPLESDA